MGSRPNTSADPNARRAIIAMSGGVDSSVAAALLVERGVDCRGVTLRLRGAPEADQGAATASAACGGQDDIEAARGACARLDIEHEVIDARADFLESVMRPFARSYARGLTPNPCVSCNVRMKFRILLELAARRSRCLVATGHYARIERREGGDHRLLRGLDPNKDQSYFLYRLTRSELGSLAFPLGDITKDETRRVARELGLANARRAESQEICFAGDRRYDALLDELLEEIPGPGPIRHVDGRLLGKHEGIHRFTVGQRRGLGIAFKEPLYVVAIDAPSRTVTVGGAPDLERTTLRLVDTTWVSDEAPFGVAATVRVRYRHCGVAGALVDIRDGVATVRLAEPVAGPAPGQAMVLYEGDRVLGGGTLQEAL